MSGFDNEYDDASWASAPGSAPSDWEFAAAAVELALVRRAGSPLAAMPDELAGRIGRAAPAHLPRVTAIETRPEPKSLGDQDHTRGDLRGIAPRSTRGRPSLALPSHGSAAGSRRDAANSSENTQKMAALIDFLGAFRNPPRGLQNRRTRHIALPDVIPVRGFFAYFCGIFRGA